MQSTFGFEIPFLVYDMSLGILVDGASIISLTFLLYISSLVIDTGFSFDYNIDLSIFSTGKVARTQQESVPDILTSEELWKKFAETIPSFIIAEVAHHSTIIPAAIIGSFNTPYGLLVYGTNYISWALSYIFAFFKLNEYATLGEKELGGGVLLATGTMLMIGLLWEIILMLDLLNAKEGADDFVAKNDRIVTSMVPDYIYYVSRYKFTAIFLAGVSIASILVGVYFALTNPEAWRANLLVIIKYLNVQKLSTLLLEAGIIFNFNYCFDNLVKLVLGFVKGRAPPYAWIMRYLTITLITRVIFLVVCVYFFQIFLDC